MQVEAICHKYVRGFQGCVLWGFRVAKFRLWVFQGLGVSRFRPLGFRCFEV